MIRLYNFTLEPFTGNAGATARNQASVLISCCTGISRSFNFSSFNIAICALCLASIDSIW